MSWQTTTSLKRARSRESLVRDALAEPASFHAASRQGGSGAGSVEPLFAVESWTSIPSPKAYVRHHLSARSVPNVDKPMPATRYSSGQTMICWIALATAGPEGRLSVLQEIDVRALWNAGDASERLHDEGPGLQLLRIACD